jgi:hypothetical protein
MSQIKYLLVRRMHPFVLVWTGTILVAQYHKFEMCPYLSLHPYIHLRSGIFEHSNHLRTGSAHERVSAGPLTYCSIAKFKIPRIYRRLLKTHFRFGVFEYSNHSFPSTNFAPEIPTILLES